MVGDNQPQSGNNENENQRCQIDGEQATRWDDAVYKPGKANAQIQYEKTDQPVGNKFGQRERETADGSYVNLFNRTDFFFSTTFKAGRKPCRA